MKNMNRLSNFSITKAVTIMTVSLAFLIACKKSNDGGNGGDNGTTSACSGPAKSFANDVNPIFQSTCATNSSCHGSGSINGPGELIGYSKIFNARSDIRSQVASGRMPLTGSLTTNEKNAILCWIDNGAPNN
jgi:hypothetical protein